MQVSLWEGCSEAPVTYRKDVFIGFGGNVIRQQVKDNAKWYHAFLTHGNPRQNGSPGSDVCGSTGTGLNEAAVLRVFLSCDTSVLLIINTAYVNKTGRSGSHNMKNWNVSWH
uniref:Phosphoserine phosphatase n=1 Tax=Myotis myotis TaxID=51298 RepID=A0A7J7Y224_MYOMY|nr:phosphoserine phosphatase [Myotis myotis]